MLMSHEWELPHLGRRLNGFLQSPAEVAALLREEDVTEGVLACESPEVPPRLSTALRDTGIPDYLRPALHDEVDQILHGPSRAAPAPKVDALRTVHAH